jgi:hypothetical protein
MSGFCPVHIRTGCQGPGPFKQALSSSFPNRYFLARSCQLFPPISYTRSGIEKGLLAFFAPRGLFDPAAKRHLQLLRFVDFAANPLKQQIKGRTPGATCLE